MKVTEYWCCGVDKEHGLMNHFIKKKLIMFNDPVLLSEQNILQKQTVKK